MKKKLKSKKSKKNNIQRFAKLQKANKMLRSRIKAVRKAGKTALKKYRSKKSSTK